MKGKLSEKEKLSRKKKMLAHKDKIIALIPKGKASEKRMIISFEKVDKISKGKNKIYLFQLEKYLYVNKDSDFKKLNSYFKKVHRIIRKQATKSRFFKECLEIVLINNYKANTGYCFGEKESIRRYNNVFDDYDPNKSQNEKRKNFHWNGFWSIVSTKNGVITGCYLGDTYDREIFYK